MGDLLYRGDYGYVRVETTTHLGTTGALVYYHNPEPRKLHAIDSDGMAELYSAIAAVEEHPQLQFCIFYGAYDPVHAGADITQFAGDPDYALIRDHLLRGTRLDWRIKQLWPRMRTVSILSGDRYGGSVEWPLFAQYVVADDKARIQFSEVHLGIIPGWNGLLNAVLRTHPANARYMGQTGNPVSASQLLEMALVQEVVITAVPPDRRRSDPDQWPALWAEHAARCQAQLLAAALDLAVSSEPAQEKGRYRICTDEQLGEEVRRRIDVTRYRALKARAQQETARLDPVTQPDEYKALARQFAIELAEMGKPLAPKAVAAVSQFVQRWSAMSTADVLDRFDEAGQQEAELCIELMHTDHRRIGVNAVLTKELADRIPVFA
jgi:enoyl-CoA hydratase/carnithine racemase